MILKFKIKEHLEKKYKILCYATCLILNGSNITFAQYSTPAQTFPNLGPGNTNNIDAKTVDGDTATKVIATKLTSEIDAEQLQLKVSTYGEKIGTLGTLLNIFGLTFPTSKEDATPIIYVMVKANPSLNADSLSLLTIYQDLLTKLTDDEIFEISKHI